MSRARYLWFIIITIIIVENSVYRRPFRNFSHFDVQYNKIIIRIKILTIMWYTYKIKPIRCCFFFTIFSFYENIIRTVNYFTRNLSLKLLFVATYYYFEQILLVLIIKILFFKQIHPFFIDVFYWGPFFSNFNTLKSIFYWVVFELF